MLRSAACPRIISWPVMSPDTALAKYAVCTSFGSSPASFNASPTASSESERTPRSRYFPNRVMPIPATTTLSLMRVSSFLHLVAVLLAVPSALRDADLA